MDRFVIRNAVGAADKTSESHPTQNSIDVPDNTVDDEWKKRSIENECYQVMRHVLHQSIIVGYHHLYLNLVLILTTQSEEI